MGYNAERIIRRRNRNAIDAFRADGQGRSRSDESDVEGGPWGSGQALRDPAVRDGGLLSAGDDLRSPADRRGDSHAGHRDLRGGEVYGGRLSERGELQV